MGVGFDVANSGSDRYTECPCSSPRRLGWQWRRQARTRADTRRLMPMHLLQDFVNGRALGAASTICADGTGYARRQGHLNLRNYRTVRGSRCLGGGKAARNRGKQTAHTRFSAYLTCGATEREVFSVPTNSTQVGARGTSLMNLAFAMDGASTEGRRLGKYQPMTLRIFSWTV